LPTKGMELGDETGGDQAVGSEVNPGAALAAAEWAGDDLSCQQGF
jgi:hypothetical protein